MTVMITDTHVMAMTEVKYIPEKIALFLFKGIFQVQEQTLTEMG